MHFFAFNTTLSCGNTPRYLIPQCSVQSLSLLLASTGYKQPDYQLEPWLLGHTSNIRKDPDINCCYKKIFDRTSNYIDPIAGILLPLVSSCGLLGNAAAILVLRSQGLDMKVKLITESGWVLGMFIIISPGDIQADPDHDGHV